MHKTNTRVKKIKLGIKGWDAALETQSSEKGIQETCSDKRKFHSWLSHLKQGSWKASWLYFQTYSLSSHLILQVEYTMYETTEVLATSQSKCPKVQI